MKKLYTTKTFLKMAGGRMHIPHPTPLGPPLAISYRNHQKSLAYLNHLAPSVLFLFTKRQSQKGRPWPNGPLPKYAPGLCVSLISSDRIYLLANFATRSAYLCRSTDEILFKRGNSACI